MEKLSTKVSENAPGVSPDSALQQKIDKLKDPEQYKEKYQDIEIQKLKQALDILSEIRKSVATDSSKVPWDKLERARQYLDKVLREHINQES